MRKKEYNSADEGQVADHEKRIELKRLQELEDIRDLVGTPAGMRFFRRFMEDGKIFSTSFTGNSATYFNEGARNLTLKYFNDIVEVAPEQIVNLMYKKEV